MNDGTVFVLALAMGWIAGVWWWAKCSPFGMALDESPVMPVRLSNGSLARKIAYMIDPLMRARLTAERKNPCQGETSSTHQR